MYGSVMREIVADTAGVAVSWQVNIRQDRLWQVQVQVQVQVQEGDTNTRAADCSLGRLTPA
jgi:hypothetical protein